MFRLLLPQEASLPREEQPKCVIKMICGGKYYIGRCLNFEFLTTELLTLYKRYLYRSGIREDNLYFPLLEHIVKNNIQAVEIVILFKSESGYEVLKEELNQLVLHYGKRNCLNKNNVPHVPKFKTPKSPNKWLTHNEYLNFMKLLNKYDF